MNASRSFILAGALLMALAVIAGAFGAHGLAHKLPAATLNTYNTAVDYHIYHALGLLAIGVIGKLKPASRLLKIAGALMLLGIALFSGSLYLYTLSGMTTIIAAAPFGGACLILAWLTLAVAVMRRGD